MRRLLLSFPLFLLLLSACTPVLRPGSTHALASSTENTVQVDIVLEIDAQGQAWLAATFTPLEADTHVYSMEIPRDGVDGLGRPTLLELPAGTRLQAAGALVDSLPAIDENEEGLLVYPVGPVTLRLPVLLPEGDGWVEDSVSVTYMACGNGSCRPPVLGKIIPVRVPGADTLQIPVTSLE